MPSPVLFVTLSFMWLRLHKDTPQIFVELKKYSFQKKNLQEWNNQKCNDQEEMVPAWCGDERRTIKTNKIVFQCCLRSQQGREKGQQGEFGTRRCFSGARPVMIYGLGLVFDVWQFYIATCMACVSDHHIDTLVDIWALLSSDIYFCYHWRFL